MKQEETTVTIISRIAGSIAFGLTLFTVTMGEARCATYYVSQNHPQASDENPGASDRPFKTINASLKKLQPGDTVWVQKGVYREQIMLSSEPGRVGKWDYVVIPSGKSYAQMINLYAQPGEEVVIKGSDLLLFRRLMRLS